MIEVALSLVLLAGAGLLIRSFIGLQHVDPGFRAAQRADLTRDAAWDPLPGAVATRPRSSRRVARIRAMPGVESAAGVSFLPMAGPGIGTSFYRLDRPRPADGELPSTQVRPVTPQFFRTMGIPQVAGRDFTESDKADCAASGARQRALSPSGISR